MRRFLSIFLIAVASVLSVAEVSAQTDADSASRRVVQLAQAVKALGGYAVQFAVTVGDYQAAGEYVVNGEKYSLTLGNVEVYGDAECRYEVDKSRREVAIDRVDQTSKNILNNPARAFDFIDSEYVAEIVSESADRVVLRLTPNLNGAQSGVVELTVNSRTNLPKSIVYRPAGESIRVDIAKIATTAAAPKRYNPEEVKGFEIIDFR